MSEACYDVVIAGGGMVGASLACALAPFCRVAVVESVPLAEPGTGAPVHQPSFDARSTALSLSSVALFESIGVWEQVRNHACAIRSIHVSDRGRFGSTCMDAAEEELEALGYIAENQWLGAVLHGALRARTDIAWLAPARVQSLERTAAGIELGIADAEGKRTLRAELAVVADGARSALAARLGVRTEQRSYAQSALIANIAHAKPHAGRAFERFTDAGPLAMLPLPDAPDGRARSALVWVQSPESAAEACEWPAAQFLGALQRHFGYRLGRLLASGERHVYPLGLTEAVEQARAGIVLLGNAAHTLHPVAGQGFNLSLRDVAALADALRGARAAGLACGNPAVLDAYVAARRADHARTIRFSDALPRLFGSSALPLVAARDLALVGLDLFGPARSLLVRHATGLAG